MKTLDITPRIGDTIQCTCNPELIGVVTNFTIPRTIYAKEHNIVFPFLDGANSPRGIALRYWKIVER